MSGIGWKQALVAGALVLMPFTGSATPASADVLNCNAVLAMGYVSADFDQYNYCLNKKLDGTPSTSTGGSSSTRDAGANQRMIDNVLRMQRRTGAMRNCNMTAYCTWGP